MRWNGNEENLVVACLHFCGIVCQKLSITMKDKASGFVTLCSSEKACLLLLLVICLAYSSTLKMEELSCSETSGSVRATQHYNPEDRTLRSHGRESLKPNTHNAVTCIPQITETN
jgi:hypothetical protein